MPDVEDDLVATIEQMADSNPSPEMARRLEWLVDMLILRGHLKPAHRRVVARLRNERTSVRLAMYPDKYEIESPPVPCGELLHLCKGRCCTFSIALSPQDIREGKLKWDLYEPYALAKDGRTGYCRQMRHDGGCSCYGERPGTCRAYDCRDDRRVWLDYDKRVAAPMPTDVVPLGEWSDAADDEEP